MTASATSPTGRDELAPSIDRDHARRRPADSTALAASPIAFDDVYREWFDPVCRWLRALGGPEGDLEDLAQQVFLVVRRKLESFDGQNLPGWLYRIASYTLSDHRRRRWLRSWLKWRQAVPLDGIAGDLPAPGAELERAERHRLLYRLLDQIDPKRREVLVLFEIEEMSGDEIARLVGIPVATVWTRLHKGRRELLAAAERHRLRQRRRAEDPI